MRRIMAWDVLATLAIAAIAVPYVGYLANGNAPFVQDARGMAAVGLILGGAAFIFAWTATGGVGLNLYESGMALFTVALGVAAFILAEGVAAEQLLAAFLAAMALTWALVIVHHGTEVGAGLRRAALPG